MNMIDSRPRGKLSSRLAHVAGLSLPIALVLAAGTVPAVTIGQARIAVPITVRTETFGRPPYAGATYLVYERGGRTICTKLAVCDKYEHCETSYYSGRYVDWPDTDGQAFSRTAPVAIAAAALPKHVCLTRFGFVDTHRAAH